MMAAHPAEAERAPLVDRGARPLDSRTAAMFVCALLWFAYAYVHQRDDWNQYSRLCLLHALVGEHSLRIDGCTQHTGDRAYYEGHYYSDKPPSTALLALPAFAASAAALRVLGVPLESSRGWLLSSWAATAGSVGLLCALAGAALFSWLATWTSPRTALIATAGVALASLPFAYATMLMAHGASYGLLLLALFASEATAGAPPARRARLDLAVGFACGLVAAGEYAASLGAGAVMLLAARRGKRAALCVGLGALPALLLVPLYHLAAFGSPWTTGYGHLQGFTGMQRGFFGIELVPKPSIVFELLFGGYRGLFAWSPFLLLAFPGLPELRARSRALFVTCVVVCASQVLLISTYPYWHGGFALGPRHLMVCVPFLALAAGLGCARLPKLARALLLLSSIVVFGATLLDALPPETDHAPLSGHYPRLIQAGEHAPNLGSVLGLQGYASVWPLVFVLVLGFGWLYRRLGTSRRELT